MATRQSSDRSSAIHHTVSEQTGVTVCVETVEWLLAGDQAIRWQTMRDLLDAPLVEVEHERTLVATTGWGWNCRAVRFGDQHSSFHTSILALEALAQVDASDPGRTDVGASLQQGREFFLDHGLYRSHRDGSVVNPAFTKLSFPPRWHFDVLRGLELFQRTDADWDDRLADALHVVASRRRLDGTWPAQNRHAGRDWFEMERTGGPSRWNTLRALRVQKWANRTRRTDHLPGPALQQCSRTGFGHDPRQMA